MTDEIKSIRRQISNMAIANDMTSNELLDDPFALGLDKGEHVMKLISDLQMALDAYVRRARDRAVTQQVTDMSVFRRLSK